MFDPSNSKGWYISSENEKKVLLLELASWVGNTMMLQDFVYLWQPLPANFVPQGACNDQFFDGVVLEMLRYPLEAVYINAKPACDLRTSLTLVQFSTTGVLASADSWLSYPFQKKKFHRELRYWLWCWWQSLCRLPVIQPVEALLRQYACRSWRRKGSDLVRAIRAFQVSLASSQN